MRTYACRGLRVLKRSVREGSGLRAISAEGARGLFDFLKMSQTPSIESKKSQDVTLDGFDGAIGIDNLNSLVLGSQFEIAVPHPVIEFQVLRFESTFVFGSRVIAVTRTSESNIRLDIEEKGYIGPIRT